MRAFDVLTKAEYDIRASTQPRYHLELALLRWVHLRRLVPLTDILQGLEKGGPSPARTAPASMPPRGPVASKPSTPSPNATTVRAIEARRAETVQPVERPRPAEPARPADGGPQPAPVASESSSLSGAGLKEALLAELQKVKKFFYGTVIAQAQGIEVEGDRIVFTFGNKHLRQQLEQNRPLLEDLALRLAGRKIGIVAVDGAPGTSSTAAGDAARGAGSGGGTDTDKQSALKQKALADSGVQALLDVFRTDIKEVEEI